MMDKMVFLVGMPRCGTTNLCNILSQHPNINAGRLKEPGFFLDDCTNRLYAYNAKGRKIGFRHLGYLDNENDYIKNYTSLSGNVWLDGTTIYSLHTDSFIHSLKKSNLVSRVEKKFIVLYRSKSRRAVSHYLFSLSRGEEFREFEDALSDELSGADKDWLLGGYVKGGDYEGVVASISDQFGNNSIRCYDIEKINLSSRNFLNEITSFIGVEKFSFDPSVYNNSNFSSNSKFANILRLCFKKIKSIHPLFFEKKIFRNMFEFFCLKFGNNKAIYNKKVSALVEVYEKCLGVSKK